MGGGLKAYGEAGMKEPSWVVALQAVLYYRVGCFCDSVAVCRDKVYGRWLQTGGK
jgi:hypothetical protein